MLVLWLIVWLLSDTPVVRTWNDWAIAGVVCLAIDMIGIFRRDNGGSHDHYHA